MASFLFGFSTTRNATTITPDARQRFHITLDDDDRARTQLWNSALQDASAQIASVRSSPPR